MKFFPWPIVIWLTAIFAIPGKAADWRLIELNESNLNYRSYFEGGRDPLVTGNGLKNKGLGKHLELQNKMGVLDDVLYLDTLVHGDTDSDPNGGNQFRVVGLEARFGFNVTDWLKAGYYHHSQHVLDTTYAPGFPVIDGLELQLNLYRRGSK